MKKNAYMKGKTASYLCIMVLIILTGCNSPTNSESDQRMETGSADQRFKNVPPPEKIGPGVLEAIAKGENPNLVISLNADLPKGLEKRKNAVAAAQDKVLALVTDSEFDVTYSFNTVASLAGKGNSEAAIRRLAADKRVRKIDLDMEVNGSLLTSVPLINADERHVDGNRGEGVTVAVLDSGFDSDHPDLVGSLVHEACFGRKSGLGTGLCPDGTEEQTGLGSAEDDHDHGTHVSAIVASRGVVGGAGVAPGANIAAIKVLDNTNSAADFAGIIAALDYIFDNPEIGVDVINMSLGGGSYAGVCDNQSALTESLAEVVNLLKENGVTVIASAGNNGSTSRMGLPACLSGVMSVGASDNNDDPASFTNSNSETDVFAPGVGIVAAKRDGGTVSFSGTSMSSPTVAGCAALLIEAEDATTPDEIESRIKDSDVFISRNGLSFPRLNCKSEVNAPPVVETGIAQISVLEGSKASNTGTYSDADNDAVTLSASIGAVIDNNDGTWSWTYNTTDGPAESQSVTISISDGINPTENTDFQLIVNNADPFVQAGPSANVTSGSDYIFTGNFDDAGINDSPWNWTITWGDGSLSQGSTSDQTAPIISSIKACSIGDQTITLQVTDKDNGIGFSQTTITAGHLPVQVLITPSGKRKPVNTRSGGRLPVSIIGSADISVADIDISSLLISDGTGTGVGVAQKPNGEYFATFTDVNDDGITDLLVHIEIPALVQAGNLNPDTGELTVTGSLTDNCTNFKGSDTVLIML